MKQPRFDVYKSADGWRWRLVAANGRILCQGESHTREADAFRAVDAVSRTAPVAWKRLVVNDLSGGQIR